MSNIKDWAKRYTGRGFLVVTATLLATISVPANALVYGGLEGLRVASDPDPATTAILGGPGSSVLYDDPTAAIRAFGGSYVIRDYVSVEVGYTNLGEFRTNVGTNRFDVDMESWDLTGVGHWPIATVLGQKIGIYASVGMWLWDSTRTLRVGGEITRVDNYNLDLGWGGGIEIELFNLALIRLNFVKLEVDGSDAGVSDITLGGITVGFDL